MRRELGRGGGNWAERERNMGEQARNKREPQRKGAIDGE